MIERSSVVARFDVHHSVNCFKVIFNGQMVDKCQHSQSEIGNLGHELSTSRELNFVWRPKKKSKHKKICKMIDDQCVDTHAIRIPCSMGIPRCALLMKLSIDWTKNGCAIEQIEMWYD